MVLDVKKLGRRYYISYGIVYFINALFFLLGPSIVKHNGKALILFYALVFYALGSIFLFLAIRNFWFFLTRKGPPQKSAKRYYRNSALFCLMGAVGLILVDGFLLLISHTTKFHNDHGIFLYIWGGFFILLLIYLAVRNYKLYQAAPSNSVVYMVADVANPRDLPLGHQLRSCERLITVFYFILPLLCAQLAWDLKQLEDGKVKRVFFYLPMIDIIYKYYGYWAAVLAPLCLGVLGILMLKWRRGKILEQMKKQIDSNA